MNEIYNNECYLLFTLLWVFKYAPIKLVQSVIDAPDKRGSILSNLN